MDIVKLFLLLLFLNQKMIQHRTVEVNITCKDKSHTAAVHYGVVE